MKFNFFGLIGIIMVTFIVGLAVGDVGTMTPEPHLYTWTLPVATFCAVGIPFILGCLASLDL